VHIVQIHCACLDVVNNIEKAIMATSCCASENSVPVVYFSTKQIDTKQLSTAKWCSNMMTD
jgi:hypothetical protein